MAADAEASKNEVQSPRSDSGYLQRQWSKLSPFQLVLICIATALITSGHVSWTDILFCLASTAYFVFFAVKVFPSLSKAGSPTPVDQAALLFRNSQLFKMYMIVAAFLGLFIPCVFILAASLGGFEEGIRSTAPHVFLLVAQIISETGCADVAVSDPIRVLVPASYNTMRLVTLVHWTKVATSRQVGSDQMLLWQVFEALLAITNLAFWTYNLVGFLLPVYLPIQLRFYYNQEAELKRASAKGAD
eukprot:TRINITY_DN17399_c0_g1_i1.p1 TRINITY_DN17399_c0_g1~~TRINITY_DN17399_c0_g1_i1.p1  ORF type:complete len:245 (+),score=10.02 TRINITY_DN17399_c0_g1_i1:84-818(+)